MKERACALLSTKERRACTAGRVLPPRPQASVPGILAVAGYFWDTDYSWDSGNNLATFDKNSPWNLLPQLLSFAGDWRGCNATVRPVPHIWEACAHIGGGQIMVFRPSQVRVFFRGTYYRIK